MLRFIAAVGLSATVVANAWAQSPAGTNADGASPCVQVTLLDADHLPIHTDQPVIGLMAGKRPVISESVPPYATLTAGARAACPAKLIADVREIYEQSCLTTERRGQTALLYKTDVKSVAADCKLVQEALARANADVTR